MSASTITISLGLFLLAGLFEIAGGWLVWQWIRDAKPWPWGLLGGSVLFLYGVIPTFQPAHFGRVYAAYGGFFFFFFLLLGWIFDGKKTYSFDFFCGGVDFVCIG